MGRTEIKFTVKLIKEICDYEINQLMGFYMYKWMEHVRITLVHISSPGYSLFTFQKNRHFHTHLYSFRGFLKDF